MKSRVLTTVDVTVTNTGLRDGDEVAQLYVSFPKSAGEPPLQLRRFAKVHVAAGASATVRFDVTERDLSIWDVAQGTWMLVGGTHALAVGAASDDLRVHTTVEV